jgi:drug/metabolite transporter (DMT)-like permease
MFQHAPSDSHDDGLAEAPPPPETVLPSGRPSLDPHHNKDSPLYGMAAALGAFLMLSTMSMLAKLLSATHGIVEIAFWRNLVGVLPFFVAIIAFRRREILQVESKPYVVFTRSVVATLSVLFLFGAFAYLPLADATALVFTSALFVPVFSFFFLGERVGPYRWSAILVGFLGVLIIARPSGDWHPLGVALAIGAAILNATLATMLRLLGRTERPETLTFYLLFAGLILLAPAMPFVGTVPARGEIPLLIAIGLCGVLMQLLLSTAFKYAPAALASLFSYTQIIWATLFGWAIFGQWPAANIVGGAAIIIAASVFVALREHHLARKCRLPRPAVLPPPAE